MKVCIFFITFIVVKFAFANDWPEQHYTITNLSRFHFNSLENYFSQVMISKPLKWNYDSVDIFEKNKIALKISFYEYNNILFIKYSSVSNTLLLKLRNYDIRFVYEYMFFNFQDIYSKPYYSIEIDSLDVNLDVQTLNDTKSAKFNLGWGKLHLQEIKKTDLWTSSLWYSCNSCNGDKLTLKLIFGQNTQFKPIYLLGLEQSNIDPNEFYNISERNYLGSFKRFSNNLVERLRNDFSWPSSN